MKIDLALKGLAAVVAAGAVAGLVVLTGAGTAAASTQTLTEQFDCGFTLIGQVTVGLTVTATPPSTAGQPTVITTDLALPSKMTQGLDLVGAQTVDGSETVGLVFSGSAIPAWQPTNVPVPQTSVPQDGSPFTLHGSEALGGTGAVSLQSIESLGLSLVPRSSIEPGLTTFDATCTPTVLPTTTTPVTTTTGTPPPAQSVTENYACSISFAGTQSVAVTFGINLPKSGYAGQQLPFGPLSVDLAVPASVTKVLNLSGTTFLLGQYVVGMTLHIPDGTTLPLSELLSVPSVTVPSDGSAFDVPAQISVPSLAFLAAGTATVTVDSLAVVLANPAPGQGTLPGPSPCAMAAGQNTVLATVTVLGTTTSTTQATTTPVTATTTPITCAPSECWFSIPYTATGSTHLSGATVPITDAFDFRYSLSSGDVEMSLHPVNGTVPFSLFGFVPGGSATVTLAPATPLTGSLNPGVMGGDIKETIKVTDMSVFGVPIVQASTTCLTSGLIDIPLTFNPSFTAQFGGTVSGTYSIPSMTGCGLFTPFVSAVLSGAGNTLALALKPAG
jgi:hypothetical protein